MPFPGHHTGGILFPQDNGLHMMLGVGMMKNYPPGEREALLDYLEQAPTPVLGQIARLSEPVSDVATYRVNGNQLRRWHQLDRRPDGFVVTGDAVASFNPIYAQGMSQAAQGGISLRDALRNEAEDPRPLAVRFQESLAQFTDVAFAMSGMADAFYDGAEIEGMDPPDPAEMEFFTHLEQFATEDPEVLVALVQATYSMELELLETDSIKSAVAAGSSPDEQSPTTISPGSRASLQQSEASHAHVSPEVRPLRRGGRRRPQHGAGPVPALAQAPAVRRRDPGTARPRRCQPLGTGSHCGLLRPPVREQRGRDAVPDEELPGRRSRALIPRSTRSTSDADTARSAPPTSGLATKRSSWRRSPHRCSTRSMPAG